MILHAHGVAARVCVGDTSPWRSEPAGADKALPEKFFSLELKITPSPLLSRRPPLMSLTWTDFQTMIPRSPYTALPDNIDKSWARVVFTRLLYPRGRRFAAFQASRRWSSQWKRR